MRFLLTLALVLGLSSFAAADAPKRAFDGHFLAKVSDRLKNRKRLHPPAPATPAVKPAVKPEKVPAPRTTRGILDRIRGRRHREHGIFSSTPRDPHKLLKPKTTPAPAKVPAKPKSS